MLGVKISGEAPSGGLILPLSSSSAALEIPATITVQAGEKSAEIEVNTNPVQQRTVAEIRAGDPQSGEVTSVVLLP